MDSSFMLLRLKNHSQTALYTGSNNNLGFKHIDQEWIY